MTDELITVKQAAEILKLHPHTIRKMIEMGVLPGKRLVEKAGSKYLIPLKEIEAYKQAGHQWHDDRNAVL